MITPIGTLNINQIAERKDDLLVSVDDIKMIASKEREKAVDEFAERLSNKDNIVKFDIDEVMSSGNFDYNCDCLRRYIDKIAEEMRGAE